MARKPAPRPRVDSPRVLAWLARLEAQLDLESLVRDFCKALMELSGVDRCSIMVLDSDTSQLVVRWAYGIKVKIGRHRLKFRMGEGLAGWVARSQKAFCSTDTMREPRFVPRPAAAAKAKRFREVRALCCLPLVWEGRTVGVVNLSSFSPSYRFRWVGTSPARRFLGQLARLIAQATLLREAQAITERLRRQAKATSETVAQVSHEVRTPLALVSEAAQQLLDGLAGKLSLEQEELARMIKAQAERMLSLVTELLDLSRIEAGRMSLQREPVDLAEVARDVSTRYELLIMPRRMTLQMDPVPPVYGDRIRLAEVVENLVANAVKFTPAHGAITLRLSCHGRSAEMSVSDNGIGIPPRERRRLFERFGQLKVPLHMNTRGLGLGLAIVKEVVHLHGGTIRVDSQQGRGATFTVSLPLYTPSFALTEEFRLMREHAAREGRALAVQLVRPGNRDALDLPKLLGVLRRQVSREDRVLEDLAGGVIILSVLDAENLAALKRRIQEILAGHPECVHLGELSWGWSLVPKEGTSLPVVLELARKRAGSREEMVRV